MFRKSLPSWPKHATRICKSIRSVPGPVKILLKVRNDPLFLEDWHRHHAAIVGADNLIIADNMSDDPEMDRQLHRLAKLSPVFRFSGFHNRLSDRSAFDRLWKALDEGCRWHLALDADERLGWIEDGTCITDARIVDRLCEVPADVHAVPALLLDNLPESRDRFAIASHDNPTLKVLPAALWGKPAIAAGKVAPHGMALHNVQFPASAFQGRQSPNLVQLHLCNLLPEQRLRANREKLAARGVCDSKTSYAEIASLPLKGETRSLVRRCITETRDILSGRPSSSADVPHVKIAANGNLEFSDPEAEARLNLALREAGGILADRPDAPTTNGEWSRARGVG